MKTWRESEERKKEEKRKGKKRKGKERRREERGREGRGGRGREGTGREGRGGEKRWMVAKIKERRKKRAESSVAQDQKQQTGKFEFLARGPLNPR